MNKTRHLSFLLSTALCGLAAPAWAEQESAVAPTETAAVDADQAATPGAFDIIVTARRRDENVQDVPVAISVVGGAQLEATGSFNVGRITQLQPSFQFYATNPRNTALNIRGLGAPFGLTNDGIEQGVGLYIDQVYYSRPAATSFDFLDIDRIEVLRGPQGTLYGKNTTAGALNLTSRAPSFTPEGKLEISIGNLGFVQGKAAISGPLIDDKLAIRIAASGTKRSGTIYNVTTGNNVNAIDNIGFRSALLWKATDTVDLTLSGDYNRQNPECCAQIYVRVGATQRPLNRQFNQLAAAFKYAPPSYDAFDRLTDLDSDLKAKQTFGGVSLRAEWDLGPGTLTSVSAWRFWDWDPSNDRDFTGLPITTISANPSKQRQWTQEFRYASSGENRIDYVLGLFAYHQTIDTSGVQEQGSAASRWLLSAAQGNDKPAILNGLRSENDIGFKNTSLAAFGQLTWRATDSIRIQPGLRVNYDKKKGDYTATVTNGTGTPLTSVQTGVLAPQAYVANFSDWNVSGDISLSWDVTEDVLAYATYAKSFKSGGINLAGLPNGADGKPALSAATVKPEKVDHFEIGLKTQFLDRRVTLNLAAFQTEIRDYQATVTNGQLGVLRGYLANAGKVRVRGFEADLKARPNDNITLYGNAAYTDGKYARFVDAPCPPELSGGTAVSGSTPVSAPGTPGGVSPLNCDISGQRIPGLSLWAFSYGAEYALPAKIIGVDGQAYVGFDGSYRSKFSSNPSRSAYTEIRGYALANFRLGFRSDDGWEVSGWVRNAFDQNYYELLTLQSGNTGLVAGQLGDPRTYGLTVRASF